MSGVSTGPLKVTFYSDAVYFGGAVLHGRESLVMPVDQEEVVSIVAVASPSCPVGLVHVEGAGHTVANDDGEAVISVGP